MIDHLHVKGKPNSKKQFQINYNKVQNCKKSKFHFNTDKFLKLLANLINCWFERSIAQL